MNRKKRDRSINLVEDKLNAGKNFKIVEKSDEFFKEGYLVPGSSGFRAHNEVNHIQNYTFRKAKLLAKIDDKFNKTNSTG